MSQSEENMLIFAILDMIWNMTTAGSKFSFDSKATRSASASHVNFRKHKKSEGLDLYLFLSFLSFETYYLIFAWSNSLIPIITVVNFAILLILNIRISNSKLTDIGSPSNQMKLTTSLFLLFLIYGVVIGISNFGMVTVAISLRIILYPYLVFRVIKTFSSSQLNRVTIFLGYTLFLNAVASTFQVIVGVDYLINNFSSLQYGLSIREIGNDIRPPGLMRTNVHLGLYGAIFALIVLNFDNQRQIISKLQKMIFLFSALTCMFLSTSRSAYLVFILGWAMYKSKSLGGKLLGKVVIPLITTGITFFVFSPEIRVLFQRILVWGDISSLTTFVGNGIGSIGGATASRFSSGSSLNYRTGYSEAIFADNYYLSLLFQFGWLIGFALILTLLLASLRLIQKGSKERKPFLKGIVLGYLVVANFLDIGEYYGASILICIGIIALSRPKKASA
jgi:hypothetical protein